MHVDLDKLLLTAAWPQFVMGCINIITYDNEHLKHPECFLFIYSFTVYQAAMLKRTTYLSLDSVLLWALS